MIHNGTNYRTNLVAYFFDWLRFHSGKRGLPKFRRKGYSRVYFRFVSESHTALRYFHFTSQGAQRDFNS